MTDERCASTTILGQGAEFRGGTGVRLRALVWATLAGFLLVALNALLRKVSITLGVFETAFLRYLLGTLTMLPLLVRGGLTYFRPNDVGGQFSRGAVLTLALLIWFVALPYVNLADITVIAFTSPIYIMLGAVLVFKEKFEWQRALAVLVGFVGVLIAMLPRLGGGGGVYLLLMLAASPVFAASYLLTKGLTRYERAEVIVLWQSISVTVFMLPFAAWGWQSPSFEQWVLCALCGLLGTLANYALARAYAMADISATQSVRFLDLVWACGIGWLFFSEYPSRTTIIGGTVICISTFWIVRHESRRARMVATSSLGPR